MKYHIAALLILAIASFTAALVLLTHALPEATLFVVRVVIYATGIVGIVAVIESRVAQLNRRRPFKY